MYRSTRSASPNHRFKTSVGYCSSVETSSYFSTLKLSSIVSSILKKPQDLALGHFRLPSTLSSASSSSRPFSSLDHLFDQRLTSPFSELALYHFPYPLSPTRRRSVPFGTGFKTSVGHYSRPQASQRRFKTPSRLSRPPAALLKTLQDLTLAHYPLFTSVDFDHLLGDPPSFLNLAMHHFSLLRLAAASRASRPQADTAQASSIQASPKASSSKTVQDLALALPHSLPPPSRPPPSQATLNFVHSSPHLSGTLLKLQAFKTLKPSSPQKNLKMRHKTQDAPQTQAVLQASSRSLSFNPSISSGASSPQDVLQLQDFKKTSKTQAAPQALKSLQDLEFKFSNLKMHLKSDGLCAVLPFSLRPTLTFTSFITCSPRALNVDTSRSRWDTLLKPSWTRVLGAARRAQDLTVGDCSRLKTSSPHSAPQNLKRRLKTSRRQAHVLKPQAFELPQDHLVQLGSHLSCLAFDPLCFASVKLKTLGAPVASTPQAFETHFNRPQDRDLKRCTSKPQAASSLLCKGRDITLSWFSTKELDAASPFVPDWLQEATLLTSLNAPLTELMISWSPSGFESLSAALQDTSWHHKFGRYACRSTTRVPGKTLSTSAPHTRPHRNYEPVRLR
ncbi:hypothetical protein DFH08DRAFT_928192 [Mycena albidolilacea]|uniref:Uncharacterized protein n=1 Tax=Mycena albidolilacea TaxID=1033008 RepID=A0AAD7F6J2_9AGAR|nr:hypothetical protein DFH08DRAFT_928192 [Mycena albidolilacea]